MGLDDGVAVKNIHAYVMDRCRKGVKIDEGLRNCPRLWNEIERDTTKWINGTFEANIVLFHATICNLIELQ
jgi:hypothetical protein